MHPTPSAFLAMAVLVFVPGMLVLSAFRSELGLLKRLTLAPALSLAVVFILGEATQLAGVPFGPVAFLATLAGLGVLAYHGRRQTPHASEMPAPGEASPQLRRAHVLLAAAILLCSVTWAHAIGDGSARTPPKRDSANHGVIAARIARFETMDPARVLAYQTPGGGRPADFYPMAFHGEVALANRVAGVPIADGLVAGTVLFLVVVLPLGIFGLARKLLPAQPLFAGIAAFLLAGIGFFPFIPWTWGGLALIVGTCITPAVALSILKYIDGKTRWMSLAIAAMASVAVFGTHTSELALTAMLVASIVLETVVDQRSVHNLKLYVGRATLVCAAFLLLVLPSIPQFLSDAGQKATVDHVNLRAVPSAFVRLISFLSFPHGLDVVFWLAVAGLAVCLYRRSLLSLALVALANLLLFLFASTTAGPLRNFTMPWYHQPDRLALNFVLILPFFGAFAVLGVMPLLKQLLRNNTAVQRIAVPVAWAVVAGVALTWPLSNGRIGKLAVQEYVLIEPSAERAFEFLRRNTASGDRVLNDRNNDGALWAYTYEGVELVFDFEPKVQDQHWKERKWLLEHVGDFGRDPRVQELLRKYNVRYVYFNERQWIGDGWPPRELDLAALRSNPSICEPFHRGTAHVFEFLQNGTCQKAA